MTTPQELINRAQGAINENHDSKDVANSYELQIIHREISQLKEGHREELEALKQGHKEKLEELKKSSEENLGKLGQRVAKIEQDKEKALLWGIATLGSAVLLMAGWFIAHLPWISK